MLSHGKEKPALALSHCGQRSGKEPQFAPVLPAQRGGAVLATRKRRLFRRAIAVVEKTVKRNLQSASVFFQGLHRRHGVTVLHARSVAAQKSGALLDVALAQVLGFPDFSKLFAY